MSLDPEDCRALGTIDYVLPSGGYRVNWDNGVVTWLHTGSNVQLLEMRAPLARPQHVLVAENGVHVPVPHTTLDERAQYEHELAAAGAPLDLPAERLERFAELGAPPRASLADRERRDFGIEPHPAYADPVSLDPRHGRVDTIDVREAFSLGTVAQDPRTPLARRLAISSALDVDLGPALTVVECERAEAEHRRVREGMSARDTARITRALLGLPQPEDRHASAQFDGDEPPQDEPHVDVADYVSGLEADVRRCERHAEILQEQLTMAQAQLDEALARCLQLEADALRDGGAS